MANGTISVDEIRKNAGASIFLGDPVTFGTTLTPIAGTTNLAMYAGGAAVTGNVGTSSLTRVNMGNEYGTGAYWQGYGFENMVFTGALSAEDQDELFAVINNKWAVYTV
jgi:hypothetical protein